MKRTQTHVVGAAFFQLHVLTHDIDDVNSGQQILNKTLRNHVKNPMHEDKTASRRINLRSRNLRDHLLVWRNVIPPTPIRKSIIYLAKAALTSAEITVISARPANLGFNTAINLPISCGPAAPTSTTAASTAACISAAVKPSGI